MHISVHTEAHSCSTLYLAIRIEGAHGHVPFKSSIRVRTAVSCCRRRRRSRRRRCCSRCRCTTAKGAVTVVLRRKGRLRLLPWRLDDICAGWVADKNTAQSCCLRRKQKGMRKRRGGGDRRDNFCGKYIRWWRFLQQYCIVRGNVRSGAMPMPTSLLPTCGRCTAYGPCERP